MTCEYNAYAFIYVVRSLYIYISCSDLSRDSIHHNEQIHYSLMIPNLWNSEHQIDETFPIANCF